VERFGVPSKLVTAGRVGPRAVRMGNSAQKTGVRGKARTERAIGSAPQILNVSVREKGEALESQGRSLTVGRQRRVRMFRSERRYGRARERSNAGAPLGDISSEEGMSYLEGWRHNRLRIKLEWEMFLIS